VHLVARLALSVDDEVARGDGQDRNDTENKVADHQSLGLLLEELFVVAELVRARERQVVPVNHIVVAVEVDVIDVVDQDN